MNYFDYAAASPVHEDVLSAMIPYYTELFYNPSASYEAALNVKKVISVARSKVAKVLGVKTPEIIFTAGCTEANNIAIHGVMSKALGKKILISGVEHDSVLETAKQYMHELIPVHTDGRIDMGAFKDMLGSDVAMVSCIYAQNEIGTVQPLREIAQLIKSVAPHIIFHSDAAQAPLYLTLDVHSLGLDMMSLNGGKIYGPKQSGCLYISSEVVVEQYMFGGGQERGLRSGTENVPNIVGFTTALLRAQDNRHAESERLRALQKKACALLESIGGVIVGSMKYRTPNHIAVCFDGTDNERLTMQLDELGFMVSAGSACHAKTGSSSAVLGAIGMTKEAAQSVLRVTCGSQTTEKQLMSLVETIKKLLP